MKKTKTILLLVASFVLGATLMGGVCAFRDSGASSSEAVSNKKLAEIQEMIDAYYLNDYDEEDLANGIYKGYVDGLQDPYSTYMSESEYESWSTSTVGEYSGVGITFSEDENGNNVVVSIIPDSPAAKTEIKPGDYILSVDGKTYSDVDTLAANIRGESGTEVTLEIYHDGKTIEVTMTRKKIHEQSVSYEMLDDKTGYIRIDSFIDNTGKDFSTALDSIVDNGAKALILDLRDNGGGLVNQSVEVADEFLDKGPVCHIEYKDGSGETLDAKEGKTKLDTVILVNENSASAAEILAGALKDNGYELVGQTTFGKGVIQITQELSDGSALKLTVAQYLSPKKNVIHKKGVAPNHEIADKENTKTDEQLEKAKELIGK